MTRSHGILRGLIHVNKSSLKDARFGRMFRWLPGETYQPKDLKDLAEAMIQFEHAHVRGPTEGQMPPPKPPIEGPDVVFNKTPPMLDTPYHEPEPGDENPTMPAGFTYFGQFIDHDLTFDPNSSLQKQNDPDATEDFRTPRFDLDSLYGRGPDDQPYLYKNHAADGGGIRFLLGRRAGNPGAERRGELPRNVEGRALVGDPRNDENNIICQLQTVFLNFHNRVVDELTKVRRQQLNDHEIFQESQRIVRWHYQYLVLNDYLRHVVGDETWKHVYHGTGRHHPSPNLVFYTPKGGQAYMPVEFSVAAFRFGHSMVRPSYALRANEAIVGGDATVPFPGDPRFHRIPIFSDQRDAGSSLDGFGPLTERWEIDWRLFFCKDAMPTEPSKEFENGVAVLQVKKQAGTHFTQPGYRIDTQLVDPLAMLPPNVARSGNMPDGIPSLGYRNLLRGSAFALPSGQNVARALGATPLTEAELWNDSRNPKFKDPAANPFAFRAPLWFYILKEAEGVRKHGVTDGKGGHHLGPVGGRIVAEVLVGIALNDHTSFLSQDPGWTPAKEKAKSGFDAGMTIESVFGLIDWATNGAMRF